MESEELIATELKGSVLPEKKETGAAMGRAEPGRVETASAHGKLQTPVSSWGSTPVISCSEDLRTLCFSFFRFYLLIYLFIYSLIILFFIFFIIN